MKGTIPERLIKPTVGLMPTTDWCVAGLSMEPVVSVPTVAAAKAIAAAAAEPVLEPPTK
ncbi:hypothetical protein D3C73_1635420 [compost metagenome]